MPHCELPAVRGSKFDVFGVVQADNVKQLSQGVKASVAAFWTGDRLQQLCHTLAYHFLTLTVITALSEA